MSEFNYPTAGFTSGNAISELLSDRTINDAPYESLCLAGSLDSHIVEGLNADQGLQRISTALYWPGGTPEAPGNFVETVPYGNATPEERLAIAEETYRLIAAAHVGKALLDSLPVDYPTKHEQRHNDRSGLETAISICRQRFLPLAVFDISAIVCRVDSEPTSERIVELWHPNFTVASPILRQVQAIISPAL